MDKKIIIFNEYVVLFFKDATRCPVYGFFVSFPDHEELKLKNMVRFVSRSKDIEFNNKPIAANTRVIDLKTIKNFKHDES